MRSFLEETTRSRRIVRQASSSWVVAAHYLLRAIGRLWFATSRFTRTAVFVLGLALAGVGAFRLVALSGYQPTRSAWSYCGGALACCFIYAFLRESSRAPRLAIVTLRVIGLVGGVVLVAAGADAFLPLVQLKSSF
jgi:hypothetical protein